MIYGVYGLPDPLWQRGIRLGDLGINTVHLTFPKPVPWCRRHTCCCLNRIT